MRRSIGFSLASMVGVLVAWASALWPAPLWAEAGADKIDQMLEVAWKKAGITPARMADDATFLRRVTLNLGGRVPHEEEVREFLSDKRPDKRKRRIDSLLLSPGYAEHFSHYWESILLGAGKRGDIDREAFRRWLTQSLAQGRSYDRLVYDLITAKGLNNEEGSVNFVLYYADRPEDLAGVVSREFLGVQIQCAQCHDHPTERFKQESFRQFASCFTRIQKRRVEGAKVKGVQPIEVFAADRPRGPKEITAARPTAIDGALINREDPRGGIASWIAGPQNPWFAKALVNRYWSYLVGRGFFEPVDDLRASNPPVLPEVLAELTREFVLSGYDLRGLLRRIARTQAYQLSAELGKDKGTKKRDLFFARHPLRPLSSIELFDAIVSVTGLSQTLEEALLQRRSKQRPGQAANQEQDEVLRRIRDKLQQSVTQAFQVDEEVRARSAPSGTVEQALFFMNGALLASGVSVLPKSTLAAILASSQEDKERLTRLYLRVLGRMPTGEELGYFVGFVNQERTQPAPQGKSVAGPGDPFRGLTTRPGSLPPPSAKEQAYEDVFWALLNSSEFALRH